MQTCAVINKENVAEGQRKTLLSGNVLATAWANPGSTSFIGSTHLFLNSSEDQYVLHFEPPDGFISTYNVDSWRDQLYFDTVDSESTPLKHFNARVLD